MAQSPRLGTGDQEPLQNVFGKTFKIALADGKVSSNPARLVEQRPEKNGRIRFLSAEEEKRLREAIQNRCSEHLQSSISHLKQV